MRFPPEAIANPALRTRAHVYAIALLACFALTVAGSYGLLLQPRFLGAHFAACGSGLCVDWVLPVTRAWEAGVAAGDVVVSVDGRRIAESPADGHPRSAEHEFAVTDRNGEVIRVVQARLALRGNEAQRMWTIGGLIALLGALVLVRRPDLEAARLFGLFALACSVGLAIGPAAGGSHRAPALVLQTLTLIALGATIVPLTLALIKRTAAWSRQVLMGMTAAGAAIFGVYLLSAFRYPYWYGGLRLFNTAWVVSSVVVSVGLLALVGTRQPPREAKQAWITLTGFALGLLPFSFLTFVPIALDLRALSGYVTVLSIVAIPIAFAVAILQYEMLGIRRLIHRGIVYGVTGAMLLLGVSLTLGHFGNRMDRLPVWAIAFCVVAGVMIFQPLQLVVRRFIDRYVYRDTVDYGNVIDTVRTDLAQTEQTHGIAGTLMGRIVDSLNLESALLFLGDDPASAAPAVRVGPRVADVAARLGHITLPLADDGHAVEFGWESNSMLLTSLSRAGTYLGHVIWGPKLHGEVFIADERRVIEAMAPILTLVLEERALSERLRDLNRRLLKAEESERRRIAQDLHDGPLQKAVLLGGLADGASVDRGVLARELTAELREVCARLRPAILDDLGLIPALDWLLIEASRHADIRTELRLERVDEESRFRPDLELVFFRVTQESINNILKHARATTITVALKAEGEELKLRVRDDGVGFSSADLSRTGLGLPGMRERVLQIDGQFEVRSEPGGGTEMRAAAPIVAPGEADADVH